jgi:hypothetical protein
MFKRSPTYMFCLLCSVGCTKGVVNFAVLDQNNIPQPLFARLASTNLLLTSAAQVSPLAGTCDVKINSISAQLVGVNAAPVPLDNLSTVSATVNCGSTGKFAFTLKDLSDLLGNPAPTDNTSYVVQLRGITDGGISNPTTINIHYSTTGAEGPKHILITSGGTVSQTGSQRFAASTSFKAQVRVDHLMVNQPTNDFAGTASSTSFRMKTGAAAEAD